MSTANLRVEACYSHAFLALPHGTGAQRPFMMRRKDTREVVFDKSLPSGSAFVMAGETQGMPTIRFRQHIFAPGVERRKSIIDILMSEVCSAHGRSFNL